MNYQALDTFAKAWAFKRQDLLIEAVDLRMIRPLAEDSANQIWRDYISGNQLHPDHLSQEDWLKKEEAYVGKELWEPSWDSDIETLPDAISQHLVNWSDSTKVYFCYHSDHVIETTYSVFKKHWKNFLFFDNGPILVARKKKQAVQFFSEGDCYLLQRL
ncbi:DUF2947 family protein [Marinomonas agarivorans]|nr:DUF2947 family protein [Marinomonas agarivorans]